MNKSTLLTTLTLLICGICKCAIAQNSNVNMLSCPEYNQITYNGHTIDEINATHGDSQAIQQLFGSYDSIKKNPGMDRHTFYFGENRFTYFFLNDNVTALTIENSSWPVVIQGHTIRVGDSLVDLREAFGSDLKSINSQYVDELVVSFNYSGNGVDGLHIYIDPTTETVTKIKYWTST